jgi:aerobic-type carbon monoxide dehydrogenase small subunit (CoxS/CutS family)
MISSPTAPRPAPANEVTKTYSGNGSAKKPNSKPTGQGGGGMKETIEFRLNGEAVTLGVDPTRFLLWVLRSDLGLTGSKYGCGEGLCGACTVVVDGRAVRSCRLPVGGIKGKEVTTIEGLANNGALHPLQKAFVEQDALQCGYCTPGVIMNAYSLLLNTPRPSRSQIVRQMEGNLCRCGAHKRILQAIEAAAKVMAGA